MIDFILYLGSGKLLLFLSKKFPPIQAVMSKREFLRELYACDLCYGFWVYLFLAPLFDLDVKQIKNKLLRWVITACFTTFLSHIASIGYGEEYGTLVIEDAGR
jgi:hypothetical protein